MPDCIFGKPEDLTCLNGIQPGIASLPAHSLYKISNATIVGTIAALSEDSVLYSDGPAITSRDLDGAYQSNQSNAHGYVLTKLGQEFTAHYISAPNPQFIHGRTLFVTSLEIGNYGCFLYWMLPQLVLHSLNFNEPIDQYVVTDRSPWILEAIELLGLPRRPVFTVSEVCGARFESLTMANVISAEGFFHPVFHEAFLSLARRMRTVDGGTRRKNRRIYVSRELSHVRTPNYRILKNEAEVRELAVQRGFESVFPETLSFKDQIRLFDSAAVVVGPSGSGMLNTIFSPRNAVVVDLEFYHVTVRQHARIYASTGKIYSFCFGQYETDDGRVQAPMRRWQLDEQNVAAALNLAEAASTRNLA
jgi:capsular polysaccharide biosynthesis protein